MAVRTGCQVRKYITEPAGQRQSQSQSRSTARQSVAAAVASAVGLAVAVVLTLALLLGASCVTALEISPLKLESL